MKTQITKILKTVTAFSLALMISLAPAFASNTGNKEKLSKEDSLMIEELKVSFELEESPATVSIPSTFEIYGSNDEILFSGSKVQWNDEANMKLIMMKRKAEFLFNTDGTQVYKIF